VAWVVCVGCWGSACSPSVGIRSKISRTHCTQLEVTLSSLVVSPAS
jgi:hypothetical protein